MFKFPSFVNLSHLEIALFWCSKRISLFIQSEIINSSITSLNDQKPPVFINNMASADPSFGKEFYSRLFLMAPSTKTLKLSESTGQDFSRSYALIKARFMRTLLPIQGRLNCTQFSSFPCADNTAVISS